MDEQKYICIDIGGTAIKYGLADERGIFVEKSTMPTEAKLYGGPGIVKKVKTIINGYITNYQVAGVAISTAGMVDPKEGCIFYALPDAIPDYTGVQLKKIVETEFNLNCAVENDVNCLALGEMWLGAGKGKSSLFCMTIGTSVGGCAVVDNKIVHGVSNSAGEVAYMRIPNGIMHEVVSTTRLVKDIAKAKYMPEQELNGHIIFDWAKKGDSDAKTAIYNLMQNLADGITNITSVLNPEIVVLGGGIMAQKEYLRPLIDEALKQRLVPDVYAKTVVDFAQLQNDAGMLGALYNLLHQAN